MDDLRQTQDSSESDSADDKSQSAAGVGTATVTSEYLQQMLCFSMAIYNCNCN